MYNSGMRRGNKPFVLVDYTHGSREAYMNKVYQVAAMIAMKYGGIGDRFRHCTDGRIGEFWKYDDPIPTQRFIAEHVRCEHIKWFISKNIKWEDDIWNADFLHGVAANGVIRWYRRDFPSLIYTNPHITELLKTCPFGGRITKDRWSCVPSLYLNHADDTPSFLAGVLSCGGIVRRNNASYVKFHLRVRQKLEDAGIPIEFANSDRLFISPIWPAIFSLKMPETMRGRWMNVRDPYGAKFYAPILWKTYISNTFVKKGLPYLKCSKSVYMDFEKVEGEEGKILKKIERARIDMNLTMLNNAVRDVVKMWEKKRELEEHKLEEREETD